MRVLLLSPTATRSGGLRGSLLANPPPFTREKQTRKELDAMGATA